MARKLILEKVMWRLRPLWISRLLNVVQVSNIFCHNILSVELSADVLEDKFKNSMKSTDSSKHCENRIDGVTMKNFLIFKIKLRSI